MLSLVLSSLIALQLAVAPQPAPAADRIPVLQRIVVVGASLSDGFGLDLDSGARTRFADVVEAGLKTDHAKVASHVKSMMFMDAPKHGLEEIEGARGADPTLLVGIDYLFWFAYGQAPSDEERAARFEKGLALLEGFTCPVLVGDLPDMHMALKGESQMTHAPLLRAEQVPAPAVLKRLNERLAQWSAEHKNVTVVPLAKLVERVQTGLDVSLRGNAWSSGALEHLFQKDLLHPTLEGSSAVWLFAADALIRARPDVPASAFEWDAPAIAKRVFDAKAPDREAKLERQRKQEEREKERAKKREPAPEPK